MKQATQTFRTIEHTDGHTDIEQLFVTSFPDSDGKMITSQVWAVIQCGQKQEKQAMANATITTREYLQALSYKGYTVVPQTVKIEDVLSLYAQIDALRVELKSADEGLKLFHSIASNGEQSVLSRLDGKVDEVDAINWQDEAIAQEADYNDLKETERSQLP